MTPQQRRALEEAITALWSGSQGYTERMAASTIRKMLDEDSAKKKATK